MARRALAVGSIAVTGAAFVAAAVGSYPTGESGPVPVGLTVLGAVLGVAIVAGAGYLYRSDVRTSHTARVAGWNLLGVALLGSILAVAGTTAATSVPGYVVVDVLAVSSVAHLLIGYNDVRRIRAEELARQRRTLAVVNRLTRHNLRNRTQVLTGSAELLAERLDDGTEREAAERIRETATELADVHGELATIQRALNDGPPEETVDLRAAVEDVLVPYREAHPDGEFEVTVPEGLSVRADDQLPAAVDHLVENAVTHGSPEGVFVRVEATQTDGGVEVTVTDRGPGLPDHEVGVLTEETEISQLEHGSGLGLWVVKSVADRYGGRLGFDTDGDGTTARLGLPAA